MIDYFTSVPNPGANTGWVATLPGSARRPISIRFVNFLYTNVDAGVIGAGFVTLFPHGLAGLQINAGFSTAVPAGAASSFVLLAPGLSNSPMEQLAVNQTGCSGPLPDVYFQTDLIITATSANAAYVFSNICIGWRSPSQRP
jgi:hypothetical protein